MRQPWRWYVLASVAALAACDDDSDGGDRARVQLEDSDVCAGEEATLFVGGSSYFGGSATLLASQPVDVPAGTQQVKVWIDGKVEFDEKLGLPEGKTTTIDLARTVNCPEPGDGDGDGSDGDDGSDGLDGGSDGGDGDGDAGTVTLLEPCSTDDNLREDAQALVAGSYDDFLCGEGDVDFFSFQVGTKQLVKLTLAPVEGSILNGEITLFDQSGNQLDVQVQNGEDANSSFLLFGSETYYVRVADLTPPDEIPAADAGVPDGGYPDAGAPGRAYGLTLAFEDAAPTTEASAGTFHGATNDADLAGLEGSYVATSVHGADNAIVPYKTLVRARLPGTETQQFVFDPAESDDGVLRVVFFDGTEPVLRRRVSQSGLVRLPFAGWYGKARSGARLRAGFTGNVKVTFPTASYTRAVVAADLLAVPTVSAVAASGSPTTLAVTSVRPEGVTVVEASAHSSETAARGQATPTTAVFDVVLDAELEADEDFVVRVRAASAGLLTLPLPEVSNLSEFIYFSDEQE